MFSEADLGTLKGIHLSNPTNLKYQNRTVYANYSNETLGGKVMISTQSMLLHLMRMLCQNKVWEQR